MAKHHPDIHILTEFSAGCLDPAIALCVAAHLEYCTQCRNEVSKLNELGGKLIDHFAASDAVDTRAASSNGYSTLDLSLDKTFAAIDNIAMAELLAEQSTVDVTANRNSERSRGKYHLPQCIRKLTGSELSRLSWKKIGPALRVTHLNSGDTKREVSLHELSAGGNVASHDHRSREITVVLSGSFSDQNGLYMAGDFLVKEAGEEHSPTASEDMDCLCLSVLESPVRFTGPLMRLINPFLKIYPSKAAPG